MVLRPLRLAGTHFDRIAGGDLTQRVEASSRNEIGVLYEALRRMQESLTRTVSTVRQGVEERSEEHTSELQSLMRISYAGFCLKKNNNIISKRFKNLTSRI